MNTRILLIDDDEVGLQNLQEELERAIFRNAENLPNLEVVTLDATELDPGTLKEHLALIASGERWDAVLIDVQLTDSVGGDIPRLLLPLELVKLFRHSNKAALVMIYSGNISDHLKELLNLWRTDEENPKPRPVEENVRVLLGGDIQDFVGRDKVVARIVNGLLNPPWRLQMERELLRTPEVVLDPHAIANFGEDPISFSALAADLRKGDKRGREFLNLLAAQGVAVVAEVYSTLPRKNVPWLSVRADCEDLAFLEPVANFLKEELPLGDEIVLPEGMVDISGSLQSSLSRCGEIVIIMVHGGEGYLLGGDRSGRNARQAQRWMNVPEHQKMFAGKVVYCFACKSISLRDELIGMGVKAFIGFPDIPFYLYDEIGEPVSAESFTIEMQKLYSKLTEVVIVKWFEGNLSIEELVEFIRLTCRKLCREFVLEKPGHVYREQIVSLMWTIAREVGFGGEASWRIT